MCGLHHEIGADSGIKSRMGQWANKMENFHIIYGHHVLMRLSGLKFETPIDRGSKTSEVRWNDLANTSKINISIKINSQRNGCRCQGVNS
jgi:hypothetical protein